MESPDLSHGEEAKQYQVYWSTGDPKEDEHLTWIRDTYAMTFAETDWVPKVGDSHTRDDRWGCGEF
ncbi:hypothetical protein F4561_002568 [Lipingzhangella halophila]|uniref:Uncharacterized protein n=1 Tax=Lipingzhangella halophila TaxID=1783352 RepID=A0A7W7RHK5_9ACTN|nr:hypothetical protein [Lipingzhangella halophila]MBB4931748.1 hypothetical protein [Lipingzhangella halophila]